MKFFIKRNHRNYLVLLLFILLFLPADIIYADDLFMYCGAGIRQPVDELLERYRQKTGKNIIVEFGGSGQLLARYKGTGKGDLFLSGSHFYTDQLKKEGKIYEPYPLVVHTPVVAVHKKASSKIKTFEDLARPGIRVGLGDKKAMALGRTAEKILESSGLKDAILKNTVVYAATVKQLTLYVKKGNVDAAIIARADAIQNPEELIFFSINKGWYSPEIVTVATLKTSSDVTGSDEFIRYLIKPQSLKVFEKYGFLPVVRE
ncbi:MAG: molybdate ABC transporter substrate-binding protein [Desulfobacteraceae bacterium]